MTDVPEMVERVAAVLALHEYSPKHWLTEAENDRERLLDLARAAIEVMREPTESMLSAAYGLHVSNRESPERVYCAMIADALKRQL